MSKSAMNPNEGLDPRSEAQLVERAQRGDRDASETLWVANRRWVAAIVLAHRPKTIAVEDLMQDVAVKFISKLDTLRDVGAFKPWLRQITVNACRGAARKVRPSVRLAQGDVPEPGEVMPPEAPDSGESVIEHQDAARLLYARVMTLPSDYREPLLMRCIREMSYQQISDVLDLPVTTIETRLARARRMLREESSEGMTEPPA